MRFVLSLAAVLALVALPLASARSAGFLFGVVVPYAAAVLFLVGLSARLLSWARSAVPFRITTTCGQQRSLPFIRSARVDNPATGLGAAVRVLLEALTFRSLFRNTRAEMREEGNLVHAPEKVLWAAALAFHYSLLVVLLRHDRLFTAPVPAFVAALQSLDGFFQVGVPVVYLSSALLLLAVAFLLLRRLLDARLRYISLPADYLPLLLILAIGTTGVLLRHFAKVDLLAVKTMAISLVTFRPVVPAEVHPLVLTHLFLVSVLFAAFPFSKLVHMAGIFLSPTRNLANDNRARRHVNPWNPPIAGHTYAEWETEFKEKLVHAGIPLDGER